jgi:hypothetical protein
MPLWLRAVGCIHGDARRGGAGWVPVAGDAFWKQDAGDLLLLNVVKDHLFLVIREWICNVFEWKM